MLLELEETNGVAASSFRRTSSLRTPMSLGSTLPSLATQSSIRVEDMLQSKLSITLKELNR